MKKHILSLFFSLILFLLAFVPTSLFGQNSQFDSIVNIVDTVYEKILDKIPMKSNTNRFARKIQDRSWAVIETNLQNKIKESSGWYLTLYNTLLAKIQQRKSDYQFSTNEIFLQIQMLDATNAIRKENNLSVLKYSTSLSLSAYNHAKDMYDNFPNSKGEKLSHYGSNGSTVKERVEKVGYAWSALSENIARNQKNINEVMIDWMNSPSHKANILSSDVTELGVAKVGPYRVQNFGKPRINK